MQKTLQKCAKNVAKLVHQTNMADSRFSKTYDTIVESIKELSAVAQILLQNLCKNFAKRVQTLIDYYSPISQLYKKL